MSCARAVSVRDAHSMSVIARSHKAASRPRNASPAGGARPQCVPSRLSALPRSSPSSDGGDSIPTVYGGDQHSAPTYWAGESFWNAFGMISKQAFSIVEINFSALIFQLSGRHPLVRNRFLVAHCR